MDKQKIGRKSYKKSPQEKYQLAKNCLEKDNHAAAFLWFKRAAEQNYIPAIEEMITCYDKGIGIPPNAKEADKYRTLLYRLKPLALKQNE